MNFMKKWVMRAPEAETAGISFCRIMLLWTLLVAALAGWNAYQCYQSARQAAESAAHHSFGKDLTFRHWATSHGGVYVPITAETQPNPYLSHVAERDIVTPSGRVLTLINPAYMVRQIHERGDESFGSRGHITSLRPTRPENAADPWETVALQAFEKGADEWLSLASIADVPYLRLMRPLSAEAGCLKCHSLQGYQVGEILGGVSVSIPWAPFRQDLLVSLGGIVAGHTGLWLLGLLFTEFSRRSLRQQLDRRRLVEDTLLLRSEELEERTAELERFTYTVSHDLKSPVVTIKSFLGFLEQDLAAADATKISKDIDYIRSAAEKMNQQLDELLQLSRLGRHVNPPTCVPFQELVHEALTLVAGRLAVHGVEVRIEPTDLTLFGDRPRLVEIWQNLVDNAAKYRSAHAPPTIAIGLEQTSAGPVFHVNDNGMGIDPCHHDKIFGLFDQLNPATEGSGLGLALVKRIVEMNKGQIWVESEGCGAGGSRFRFTLPAATNQP